MAAKPTMKPSSAISFIEELKRQWMATIDAMVDPLMIVDGDYRIVKANMAMAKLAQSEVKSIIGQNCYKVFAQRSDPCPGCKMKQAVKASDHQEFSVEGVRGERYFEVTSQPIVAPDGKREGVVQIYRDRTDAKKMQAQLLQSEKLASIGLLAGGIAHEINNPLGGILVFSQMLMKEIPPDDPHYVDVKEIEGAAKRCKRIVDDLLEFARKRPDRPSGEKSVPVDLNISLKGAVRFAQVSLKWKSIEVRENLQVSSPMAHVENDKMMQVFLNLIQNAVQAMPDGGTLTLRSYTSDLNGSPAVAFSIEDTGVGIPKENLSKIFDPFFTTKDPGEGTGLGLSICYRIVQEYGGQLDVQSELNHGTSFIATLPLADAASVPHKGKSAS